MIAEHMTLASCLDCSFLIWKTRKLKSPKSFQALPFHKTICCKPHDITVWGQRSEYTDSTPFGDTFLLAIFTISCQKQILCLWDVTCTKAPKYPLSHLYIKIYLSSISSCLNSVLLSAFLDLTPTVFL